MKILLEVFDLTHFWNLAGDTEVIYLPPDLTLFYLVGNIYLYTSNISPILVANKNVDHSDVVGASFVGAAQTTSSFST